MKIGIHTPQTSTEIYNVLTKTFEGQLTFTDVSYKNDECDTLALDQSGYEIKLPNSFFKGNDHESYFYHFGILDTATDNYLDINGSYEFEFHDVLDFLHQYAKNVLGDPKQYLISSLKKETDLDIIFDESSEVYISQLDCTIGVPLHSADSYFIMPNKDVKRGFKVDTLNLVIKWVNNQWNKRCDILADCETIATDLLSYGINRLSVSHFHTDLDIDTFKAPENLRGQLVDYFYSETIKNL